MTSPWQSQSRASCGASARVSQSGSASHPLSSRNVFLILISVLSLTCTTVISILLVPTTTLRVSAATASTNQSSTRTRTISTRTPPNLVRTYPRISSSLLSSIPTLSDPSSTLNHELKSSFLSQILIPRPPESENNRKVQSLIIQQFKDLNEANNNDDKKINHHHWQIEKHDFKAITPEGEKSMSNLIFTLNPQVDDDDDHNDKDNDNLDSQSPRLVLAAHHDSKWFRKGSAMENFIGATDSASPCAMLIDLVKSLDEPLRKRSRRSQWEKRRWRNQEKRQMEVRKVKNSKENHQESELELESESESGSESGSGPESGPESESKSDQHYKEQEQEEQDWISRNLNRLKRQQTTLQIVFFDGEEAYHQWTGTDSIYGSK